MLHDADCRANPELVTSIDRLVKLVSSAYGLRVDLDGVSHACRIRGRDGKRVVRVLGCCSTSSLIDALRYWTRDVEGNAELADAIDADIGRLEASLGSA